MKLREYFERTNGTGVLATADSSGKVDVAVYAKPYCCEEETVAFIMADRLSHHNLQSNGHAAYLFWESGGGLQGKRLYLNMIKEEKDPELIEKIMKEVYPEDSERYREVSKHLVYFHVDQVLPLLGEAV